MVPPFNIIRVIHVGKSIDSPGQIAPRVLIVVPTLKADNWVRPKKRARCKED